MEQTDSRISFSFHTSCGIREWHRGQSFSTHCPGWLSNTRRLILPRGCSQGQREHRSPSGSAHNTCRAKMGARGRGPWRVMSFSTWLIVMIWFPCLLRLLTAVTVGIKQFAPRECELVPQKVFNVDTARFICLRNVVWDLTNTTTLLCPLITSAKGRGSERDSFKGHWIG